MVYVLLANGFEDIEAMAPIDILRRMGADVKTVGISGETVESARGIKVKADVLPNDVDMKKCELLVLPGGPGHEILDRDAYADRFIRYAYEHDIIIGAICAAPSVLGKRGMLNNKKGTCYTGYEKLCDGMTYTGEKCVRDGNIITSRGAGTALEFGFALGTVLLGREAAEKVKESILY